MEQKNYKRTTVTAALPYANGGVHIGHLAGVYVPADIYVRYLRMKHQDVIFIGGSDEHGVPITIRAKKEGITPQDVVDRYHSMIKKSFEEFGISFDIYSRTTSETHSKVASDFFRKLYEDGIVDDDSVADLLERLAEDDKFIRRIFSACGLTRKIIPHDRQLLSLWRGWGFGDDMILAAAQRATSAGNPVAYMNNILSSWKNSGIFSVGLIPETKKSAEPKKRSVLDKWRSTIEKYSTDDNEEN